MILITDIDNFGRIMKAQKQWLFILNKRKKKLLFLLWCMIIDFVRSIHVKSIKQIKILSVQSFHFLLMKNTWYYMIRENKKFIFPILKMVSKTIFSSIEISDKILLINCKWQNWNLIKKYVYLEYQTKIIYFFKKQIVFYIN